MSNPAWAWRNSSAIYAETREEGEKYRETFNKLQKRAADPAASLDLIQQAIAKTRE